MIKYFSILLILFVSTEIGYSQLKSNEKGEIIPFSKCEKYKKKILKKSFKTELLPSINNDSLFKKHNNGKTRNEMGSAFASGIDIEFNIDIRESGTKIDIKEGTLWILKIKSKTAISFSPVIKRFELPEGAYLCFIPQNIDSKPRTLTSKNILTEYREGDDYNAPPSGGEIIIEYFEPSNSLHTVPIILTKVIYFYTII